MKDLEGNSINLLHEPNGHLLVWGRSGQGKTYFCQRKIEEECRSGKRVLILDFSGSYTKEQLAKNGFACMDDVIEFSPYRSPFYLMTLFDNSKILGESLSNALLPLLGICGHFQKKLLRRSVKKHLAEHMDWNPAEYMETLETMLEEFREQLDMNPGVTAREDYQSIGKIMSRFEPYSDIYNFHVKLQKNAVADRKPIKIIQLSEFPQIQREFLVELIAEILWAEVFSTSGKQRWDIAVFDEMQFMRLHKGSALTNFLREGRKFGISLVLSSQFISNYVKEELETLLQAATKLIFRTTESDTRFTTNIISPQNAREWGRILRNLQVGEAILEGRYTLNGKTRVCEEPIVCRIY